QQQQQPQPQQEQEQQQPPPAPQQQQDQLHQPQQPQHPHVPHHQRSEGREAELQQFEAYCRDVAMCFGLAQELLTAALGSREMVESKSRMEAWSSEKGEEGMFTPLDPRLLQRSRPMMRKNDALLPFSPHPSSSSSFSVRRENGKRGGETAVEGSSSGGIPTTL
ncbi:dep domain containing 5, partial [Nannochloropsis oceanica]